MTPAIEIAVSNNRDWAQHEFGSVNFGDHRLNKRVIKIAKAFAKQPNASIPKAMGNWAATKATYNLFKNERVDMEPMLESHLKQTIVRMAEHKIVLCPQDTTYLNHTTHPQTEGLGSIGSSAKNPALGIILHDTLAFTTDGLALGVVALHTWTRPLEEFGKSKDAETKPIEEKESYKWLQSYQAVTAVQQQVPQTLVVSMGDREADIYELFVLAHQEHNSPHLLVRAQFNRCVDHPEKYLWDLMDSQEIRGTYTIEVPAKPGNAKREAELAIRFAQITLMQPKNCPTPNMPKRLTLWAVLAEEIDPPKGAEPISWLLLTTIPVKTFEEALEKVNWYMQRWQIELFHKVLKSGCKTEERQLKTVEQLENCLVIDAVVAWRILLLTKLGREVPHLPCSVVFEEYEWKALYAFVHKTTEPPKQEPSLQEAIRMVAKLGGFLGRKSDGQPGSMTLWRGLHRLTDIAEAWRVFGPWLTPHPRKTYG
jgi:hypothetical protein